MFLRCLGKKCKVERQQLNSIWWETYTDKKKKKNWITYLSSNRASAGLQAVSYVRVTPNAKIKDYQRL